MATDSHDLGAVIEKHLHAFDQPGVLSVRPGFKVTNGWLTDQPAVVITVRDKHPHPPAGEALPTQVDGVLTDVRQASPRKRLELEDPEAYARQLRLSPDLGSVPHFADERRLDGTRPGPQASAHAQLAAAVTKPQLTYSGPDGVTLQPVQTHATLHLSASPDSGWTTLKTFLQATAQSLSVGLYDFTSAHVLAAVQDSLAGKQLALVLDHPAQNRTADQTDAATVADLAQSLNNAFDQAWALTRMDPEATAWIYPTSYHIKVAVRDHSAFWLSSGNWNNSNQPDIDPVSNPADAPAARHGDRDWHVVIELPELADVFEQFILHDLSVAAAHNGPPQAPGAPLAPPGLPTSETPAFTQFFPAQTITETVTITPLLTPDPGVYADAVKALIGSAQHTLYMQFQYIEPPKVTDATSQAFVGLITAVVDRQNNGVTVRIIMSEFETAGFLEQLQALGLDVVQNVKVQNNVHNKGIVVDTQSVLISSQNWSTDGTLYNRDAGVIIESATVAQYFERIFLHDWEHLASQKAKSD